MIFVLSLLGATLVSGQVADGEAADVNPFETPVRRSSAEPAVQPVAPTTLDTFQFNGMTKWNGKARVSVYDTKENKSYWLDEGKLNELGLSFQRLDWENATVVLAQGGVNKKLSLNEVKIEPLKISTPRASPSIPPAPNSVSRVQPANNVETDAEAHARIQRVAEEIRRRRAERRKQLENRASGGIN